MQRPENPAPTIATVSVRLEISDAGEDVSNMGNGKRKEG